MLHPFGYRALLTLDSKELQEHSLKMLAFDQVPSKQYQKLKSVLTPERNDEELIPDLLYGISSHFRASHIRIVSALQTIVRNHSVRDLKAVVMTSQRPLVTDGMRPWDVIINPLCVSSRSARARN